MLICQYILYLLFFAAQVAALSMGDDHEHEVEAKVEKVAVVSKKLTVCKKTSNVIFFGIPRCLIWHISKQEKCCREIVRC